MVGAISFAGYPLTIAPDILLLSKGNVAGPTRPTDARPFRVWKSATALPVRLPK
jgi:hypothetical protein